MPIPKFTLAVAQDSRSPADVIDLHQVEYPPIAKAARVSGDVKLGITLGKDGLPVSVDVESGPPMLRQAAVESASHSRFKTGAATPDVVEIIYKFVFDEPVCNPSQDESRSRTSNEGNVVTVKARPAMLCDIPTLADMLREASRRTFGRHHSFLPLGDAFSDEPASICVSESQTARVDCRLSRPSRQFGWSITPSEACGPADKSGETAGERDNLCRRRRRQQGHARKVQAGLRRILRQVGADEPSPQDCCLWRPATSI